MTIQVAVMNGYGIAMASDRHVFRGDDIRSTGRDIKIQRIAGPVPAAIMAAGPFTMFGLPVARLALRLERLISAHAEAGPEALADAVLTALDAPLDGPVSESVGDGLADAARAVAARAREVAQDPQAALERVLDEIERARRCRGGEAHEAAARLAWDTRGRDLVGRDAALAPFAATPDIFGRAVAGAVGRDWRRSADLFLTIGLVCPRLGVPALIALRLWRGFGGRLAFASRLDADYEVSWRAGRTVVVAQGSGLPLIEAMIDGLAPDHWSKLPEADLPDARARIDRRWDRSHERLAVATPHELCGVATGLVRGAEVIGFLTRDEESTVAEVDCLALTARGAAPFTLAPGPERTLAA